MSLAVIIDNLLINSGEYPDLIAHPGFGMNLFLLFTTKIANQLQLVSIESLMDLSSSLEPIACVAELTKFIQLHSPFLIFLIVLSIWISLCILLKTNFFQSFLLFLIFATGESNIIHSSFIRTGTYAMFFWSVSILLIVIFFRTKDKLTQYILLFNSGLFLGLSFLSKIQVFLLLPVPLLIVIYFNSFKNKKLIYRLSYDSLFNISLFNLLFFILLSLLSFKILIPPSFADWLGNDEYGSITVLFIVFLFVYLGSFFYSLLFVSDIKRRTFLIIILIFLLFGYNLFINHKSVSPVYFGLFSTKALTFLIIYTIVIASFLSSFLFYYKLKDYFISLKPVNYLIVKIKRGPGLFFHKSISDYATIIIILSFGFLFSFLLHFFVFHDLAMSFNYMLYDFKVIYFRNAFYDPSTLLSSVIAQSSHYYQELIINISINTLLFYLMKKKYIHIEFKTIVTLIILSIILYMNILFATRIWSYQDRIWIDYPLNIYNAIVLFTIYKNVEIDKVKFRYISLLLFFSIILTNLNRMTFVGELFKHKIHFYNWQHQRWSFGVYGGNQTKYTELIKSKHTDDSAVLAMKMARLHSLRKSDAQFVFPNQIIDQKQIGILSKDFSVLIEKPHYKIIDYPTILRNSIIVDNLSLDVSNRKFLTPESESFSINRLKFKSKTSDSRILAICPRLDLDVYFFTNNSSDGQQIIKNKGAVLEMKEHYWVNTMKAIDDFYDRGIKPVPEILISDGKLEKIFKGYYIDSYTEFNLANINSEGFFVIKQVSLPL